MAAIMAGLRANPPAELAGVPVDQFVDYAVGAEMPAVNPSDPKPQQLPRADVLELLLAGGSRAIVRPSGTEPKVKAYVYATEATVEGADSLLASISAEVESILGGTK